MSLDADIDRLYQLPLNEFTAARNDLAKRAGERGAEIRKLGKPPVAAWAVNQLYWKDRNTYEALVESAAELRAAHRAVLSGKGGDLRFAGKDHEEAVERALKATLRLLADDGHPVTDATRHAITQTLRALPVDEAPGRLTRALAPGGFEMLTGIAVKGAGGRTRPAKPAAPPPAPKKPAAADEQRLAQAREQVAAAARALREAEHEARRTEFEAARAARAATRAGDELTAARADLEAARQRLERAETEADDAERRKKDADRAAAAAAKQVAAARERVSSAERAARKLAP